MENEDFSKLILPDIGNTKPIPGPGPYRICFGCAHFKGENTWSCSAYPDGIPDNLIDDLEHNGGHDRALPNDHGIRFKPN